MCSKKSILAIAGLAACGAMPAIAQVQQATASAPEAAPVACSAPIDAGLAPEDNGQEWRRGVVQREHAGDHDVMSNNLDELANASESIVDAVLIDKQLVNVPGMKVLVTEYTFAVTEWFKGMAPGDTFVVRETGGELPDGSGMRTCQSHRLRTGERYVVFARPAAGELVLPFNRVLQVVEDGSLADEQGRSLVAMDGDTMIFGGPRRFGTLRYGAVGTLESDVVEMPPPDWSDTPLPLQPEIPQFGKAPEASALLGQLRTLSAGSSPASGATFAAPIIDAESDNTARYNWCGWINDSLNYQGWFPGDDQWGWFNTAGVDWNELVGNNASGSDWLIGHFNTRNVNPVANNGANNAGYPSNTQMINGGYGSWAANGDPNGICFTWWTGNCGRHTETDVVVNPVNTNDELQFRKTIVHELGHALALGHTDTTYGIMVSGTWRVPPNYNSNAYDRMDDYAGVRAMLQDVNANLDPGSWVLTGRKDMATFSQTHPSVGSSSDYVMTTLSDYSVFPGDSIQINGMHVENRGNQAYTGAVDLDIYLSTNNVISSGDTLVWSGGWGSFGAQGRWSNGSLTLNIPNSIAPGTYYVGWIVSTSEDEISTGNNTGIMRYSSASSFAERTITVSCPSVSTPSGVAATDGTLCSGVSVSWNSVSGASTYRIYRNTSNSTAGASQIASDSASPYLDSTATAGQTYYYFVRAENGCGSLSSYSSSNAGYRASVPAAPASLTATDGTICGEVLVDWPNVSGATSYSVYRSTINSTAFASFIGSTASSFYYDSTGTPGQVYYYWVRPSNGCGSSASYSPSNSGYYNLNPADVAAPFGTLNSSDFLLFLNWYSSSDSRADIAPFPSGDGQWNSSDFLQFLNWYSQGC